MSGVVGIDLGTTFSAIAVLNNYGDPEVLTTLEGERITPSVILFDRGEIVVGTYAQQAALAYPDQVVSFVKRRMGDEDYRFTYQNHPYTASQLSAIILKKLKADAEQRLGHEITHAVITVPAYFDDIERRQTLIAGEEAGLQVLKLINEPTSAAFAYGLAHQGTSSRVLVYDLGGGTFDVSLVEIEPGSVSVLATAGDRELGGKDFDDALIDHVAAIFKDKTGDDPRLDAANRYDLQQKCTSAKISLSKRPKANIFHDFNGNMQRVSVTREEFESMTADLMVRCEAIIRDVLEQANTTPEQVDTILLAGGSTRMPMVHAQIERIFGREPATDVNPDEAVAKGAALVAAIEFAKLTGQEAPIDIRTHDVTSHSLGLVAYREHQLVASTLIPRNTRIPVERSRENYTTTHDSQTTFDLWLVQGEDPDPMRCTVLGHFEFYGIPARPAGASNITVSFRYNDNGVVEVEAIDQATGQALPHRAATGGVRLVDVIENRAPMHVALVVDCSGSMYGRGVSDTREVAFQVAEKTLTAENREIGVISFPGGIRTALTPDIETVSAAIQSIAAMGPSSMSEGLSQARHLLRPQAGVGRTVVLVSDGIADDHEACIAEIHRLKATGCRVITMGIGPSVDEVFMASLASQRDDYYHGDRAFEFDGAFINLITEQV